MVKSIAFIFLGVLFAALLISTIAENADNEKNGVEANQATSEKQLNHGGGGFNGGGGGFNGGGGGYHGRGGGFNNGGGGFHGGFNGGGGFHGGGGGFNGGGGHHGGFNGGGGFHGGYNGGGGCKWGRCCLRGGYCGCCHNAQEALAYMQNGILD